MPVWDLSAATYDTNSKNTGSQTHTPTGVAFKPDGSKLYVADSFNRFVYQYTLSTAWDVSTASYASVSLNVSLQGFPNDIAFSADGTKMYLVGDDRVSLAGFVYQYTLSTAWDLSTASYASVSKSVNAQEADPSGVAFKPDGLKMYVVGTANKTVYQYTLSTAWDVSTASYASLSKSVNAQDTSPRGVQFKDDGTVMFVVGDTNNTVYQYTLSTAWDVSTASYASLSFSVATQSTLPNGLAFKPDGSKMFIVDYGTLFVYRYTLGSVGGGWRVGMVL